MARTACKFSSLRHIKKMIIYCLFFSLLSLIVHMYITTMSGTRFSMNYVYEQTDTQVNTFYCIETSVLLDIPLVNYIRDPSGYFP